MVRSRRLAALALAALALSACASNDAKRSDVVDAMTDAGIEDEFPGAAECIGDGFDDEFDQEQLNELASADDPEDFPDDTRDTVTSIIEECTTGAEGSGSEGTTSTEGSTTTPTTASGG